MKRLIIVFLFFVPIPSQAEIILDATTYKKTANTWISSYAVSSSGKVIMSPADMQLIANLFYFSFLRSAITLEAQEIATQAMQTTWQGWQNIAQTRMNPSLKTPYIADYQKQQTLFAEFIEAQDFHRTIGTTYAHCAEIAVKGNYLSSASEKAIAHVRSQARTIVAQAILDIKKVLGELYDFASQHMRIEEMAQEDQARFDILETISSYVPYFAMKSFIEAERINTQASEQVWEINKTLMHVTTRVWQEIETARASYYLAHYNALLTFMEESNVDQEYQYVIFDQDGMIPTSNQNQLLPHLQ